jgi:hypothetical protein
VHVLRGSVSLFDAQLDGYGGFTGYHPRSGSNPAVTFDRAFDLDAGEVVSFAVGIGNNRSNSNDTTGLIVKMLTSEPGPP